jgi:hypothetical protein
MFVLGNRRYAMGVIVVQKGKGLGMSDACNDANIAIWLV